MGANGAIGSSVVWCISMHQKLYFIGAINRTINIGVLKSTLQNSISHCEECNDEAIQLVKNMFNLPYSISESNL